MRRRMLLATALAGLVATLAAACGGGSSGSSATPTTSGSTGATSGASSAAGGTESASTGEVKKGGILRIGTINYIDTLNPYNYIEAQATNAMIMVYPQLVQYDYQEGSGYKPVGDWAKSWDTSPDGKTWTFHLIPDSKWSDGKPLTADDAAWTINTTLKYADGPTAEMAPAVNHVKDAVATDPSTLVIHYAQPVGNVLAQLEQLWVLPKHVWQPLEGSDGKGLKTYAPERHLPMVVGGAYSIKQWEKKGTTVFIPNPSFYGPPSNAEAVALTYYTNSDSMISDLKEGNLDWVDQVPFTAVDVLKKDSNIVINTVPGAETTNITWNSNPRKPQNRELLDPRVKKALSMCVDRQQMIDVVFSGYADTVESLPGHVTGDLENPNLGPLEFDCAAGNQMLDQLGYKRGPDGIRVAPATTGQYAQSSHKMEYPVIVPSSLDYNGDRAFSIVQQGFANAGVKLTQKAGGDAATGYALETDSNCDAKTSTGYSKYDLALWDWVGYVDPDFMLSVVTKGQWCSWSDTGWDNPAYDKLYAQQAVTVDPEKRKAVIYKMEKIIYDNFLYTQMVNEELIDAHAKTWEITPRITNLAAYSKIYYTEPHQVG